MNVVHKMMMKKGEMTGAPSGFHDLDRLTFGFQRAGNDRPGGPPFDGQDARLRSISPRRRRFRSAETPFPTLIFSLEMSGAQLALRMLCSRARVKMQALRDGLLSKNGDEQQRLVAAADEFSKAPLFIDDSSNLVHHAVAREGTEGPCPAASWA